MTAPPKFRQSVPVVVDSWQRGRGDPAKPTPSLADITLSRVCPSPATGVFLVLADDGPLIAVPFVGAVPMQRNQRIHPGHRPGTPPPSRPFACLLLLVQDTAPIATAPRPDAPVPMPCCWCRDAVRQRALEPSARSRSRSSAPPPQSALCCPDSLRGVVLTHESASPRGSWDGPRR